MPSFKKQHVADVRYPKYKVKTSWLQFQEAEPEYPYTECQTRDCPDELMHNGSGFETMLQIDDHAELMRQINRHKDRLYAQYPVRGVIVATWEAMLPETWCLQWFNHWTFDVGQTDNEALSSFASYVDRYAMYQDSWGSRPDWVPCLMGAEDRWRWKGADDTDAPCRCEGCKKSGVIRINH